jgi:ATP-dependent Zn protease
MMKKNWTLFLLFVFWILLIFCDSCSVRNRQVAKLDSTNIKKTNIVQNDSIHKTLDSTTTTVDSSSITFTFKGSDSSNKIPIDTNSNINKAIAQELQGLAQRIRNISLKNYRKKTNHTLQTQTDISSKNDQSKEKTQVQNKITNKTADSTLKANGINAQPIIWTICIILFLALLIGAVFAYFKLKKNGKL